MKNNKVKKERENSWREIKSRKHLSNNIIALLIILFMLASVCFNLIVYNHTKIPIKITGSMVDQAHIRLCIGYGNPNVTDIYPNGWEIINGIIDVKATSEKRHDKEYIKLSFYYANALYDAWVEDGEGEWWYGSFIGNDTDGSDKYYNHSWNSTNASDGNCIYQIFVKAYSNNTCGKLGYGISDSRFSINHIDVEPKWDNFKNSLTTNFSEFENPLELGDWTAIEDATIGLPDKGLINFAYSPVNFDDADLDSNVYIDYNYIRIDPRKHNVPCLDQPAILTLNNINLVQPKIKRGGITCPSDECVVLSYSNGDVVFEVPYFNPWQAYSAAENATLRLKTWDQTDNNTIYVNENVTFFANLTDTAYGYVMNDTVGYCNIRFNLNNYSAPLDYIIFNYFMDSYYSPYSGTKFSLDSFSLPVDMKFNYSSLLYEYTRSFSSPGTFDYLVFCNVSNFFYNNFSHDLGIVGQTDNFIITNRAPVLISIMPNETWNEDTILTGRDLDDYFMDPDGEILTYTSIKVPNIDITIDPLTNIITYTPQANFYGNRTVKFYAHDPSGAITESNIVYLFVIDVPEPPPPSGGGGGGGGTRIICEELWECTEWGKCLPSGIQIRKCIDLAECGTEFRKPFESRPCEYVGTCLDLIKNCHDNSCETGVDCGGPCPPCPTCFDGIQNQGEEGIDCGGPCRLVCKTCFDGIQNQGEEDIDCGGPCPPCPSCSDKIKNCHHGLCEEKIDCGGPCPACKKIEIPAVVKKAIWPTILLIILLILAIMFVIIKYHKYYQPFIAKILMKFVPFIVLFKKRKKEVPEELKERESILLRLDKLEKSIDKKPIDELSKEFVRIVRDFLSDLLKIEYEFTYEEFCKEIEKHKISTPLRIMLITFFRKISEISYKGYKMEKPELREMVKEARIIVKLGSEEYLEGKTEKEEPKKTKLKKKQKIKKESNLMLEVYKDLIKSKKSIRESDIDSAKLAYIRIKELYEELPVKEKRKIYKKIVWLYNKIKEGALDKVKVN